MKMQMTTMMKMMTPCAILAAAAPDDDDGTGGDDDVAALLAKLELTKWQPALMELGADKMIHLKQLEDADLEELGMPRLHRRPC